MLACGQPFERHCFGWPLLGVWRWRALAGRAPYAKQRYGLRVSTPSPMLAILSARERGALLAFLFFPTQCLLAAAALRLPAWLSTVQLLWLASPNEPRVYL